MPESFPVIERIAQAIETRLRDVLRESGFRTTVNDVIRPTRIGGFSPVDKMVLLTQDQRVFNEEASVEGSPYRYGWDQGFDITLFLFPSDKDSTPLDQLENIFASDVEMALATHASWPNWGGLAVDSRIDPPDTIEADDGSLVGINVRLTVTYRTPYGDPYTAA